ncbi:MAG: type VI secretion system tip protein TssI/VgrG [Myxococcota bacterium]
MTSLELVSLHLPEDFPGAFSVRRFEIEERLSHPFTIALDLRSPVDSLDVDTMVGRSAWVRLVGANERRWQGIVEAAAFTRAPDVGDGLSSYRVSVRPNLWQLSRRTRHRMLQHASIPEMVTRILDEGSIAHRWELGDTYPALELRAQYAESDFAFVSRLLEEAGISYRFEDPGPGEPSTLVLDDHPHRRAPRPLPLTFTDDISTAPEQGLWATALRVEQSARPGAVVLREHDFNRPRAPLYSAAISDRSQDGGAEHLRYAPQNSLREVEPEQKQRDVADDLGVARYEPAHGFRQATVALESLNAERQVTRFDTSDCGVAPGTVFAMVSHPRPDVGAEPLLSVAMRLTGEVATPDHWRFEVHSVHTDRPYRPAQRTPKPEMFGVQAAVVVGPPGEDDIYVDEHARVRVQFPWDRDHEPGPESSIWMRVSQGWAGGGHGAFTIPRVGHEVLVAFIAGDVDAPVIVGRLHNSAQPAPFPLPANKTVSTLRTATSPGGGGFNELRFDDAAGREHVFMQAERDMDQLVKRDLKVAAGHDRQSYVQNDEGIAVGHNRSKLVNHHEVEGTGLSRVQAVGLHRTSMVGADDSTVVGARWSVTVARGLAGRLSPELDRLSKKLGGVLRNTARRVFADSPSDPLVATSAHTLSGFGRAAFGMLHDVLSGFDGLATDKGPPPTTLEVQDRQIRLSTGEASIVLDGPNVSIIAPGGIALHSGGSTVILSEAELALAAGGKVGVVSDGSDVVVQAQRDVHLNPFAPGPLRPDPAPPAGPLGDVPAEVTDCAVCGGPLANHGQYARCRGGEG